MAEAGPAMSRWIPDPVSTVLVMPPNQLSPCASSPSVSWRQAPLQPRPAGALLPHPYLSWSLERSAPSREIPFVASKSFAPTVCREEAAVSAARDFPVRSRAACGTLLSFGDDTLQTGSYRLIRARYMSVSSDDVTFRVRTSSESSVTGRNASSVRSFGRLRAERDFAQCAAQARGRRASVRHVSHAWRNWIEDQCGGPSWEWHLVKRFDALACCFSRLPSSRALLINTSPAISSAQATVWALCPRLSRCGSRAPGSRVEPRPLRKKFKERAAVVGHENGSGG